MKCFEFNFFINFNEFKDPIFEYDLIGQITFMFNFTACRSSLVDSQDKETFTSQMMLKNINVWWYHVGENLNGNVLLIGRFSVDTVSYIDALSQTLFHCPDLLKLQSQLTKGNELQPFDAIIINNQSADITDTTILHLARNRLVKNGKMCVFEANDTYLPNVLLSPIRLLARLFGKDRKAELTSKTDSLGVEVYSTISYDLEPNESIHNNLYNSNKNISLLKEKIKSWLFSNGFQALVTNSNIILVMREKEGVSLVNLVHEKLKNCLPGVTAEYLQCSNILYNLGKIIFMFSNLNDDSKSYIVVITFSSITEGQRINELRAIRRLSQDPEISRYMSSEVYHTQLMGFNCFIMRRCLGMTVDVNMPKLPKMIENAYQILMKISRKYRATEHDDASLLKILAQYMNAIKQLLPNHLDLLNRIEKGLLTNFPRDSLYPCLFHGDLKLENFVLDKNLSVVGVIDWELYEEQAFPMLDLLYLLNYNIQVRNSVNFLEAFSLLIKGELASYEAAMLSNYLKTFSIETQSLNFFYSLFYVHHFGYRITNLGANAIKVKLIKESLIEVINLLE